ncbi:unnamed protein product [Clonostachys rosea]|uniref:C2H2-type domain-containing protein n=1 Tax=Bionectria ochroleuca TaxID=29856 RepID=A0ABY6TT09_BIOOC|nr:unnamed protein product [Clonostachys rosea]
MHGAEISDGGNGTECGDMENVEIPPGTSFEQPKACEHQCNTNCSDFDSILNGVIQHLLVEYESSNFKALLEGYKRETKRRTHPLCVREVESYLISAAVEWAGDRADYMKFCSCLIVQTQQAPKASQSSRINPIQIKYYDELWAKVCENSQVLPIAEGSDALLAELTGKSWLFPRLVRGVENVGNQKHPPDSAYVSASRYGGSCATVPGAFEYDVLGNSDLRTTYSPASSVSDGRIENYISVLCEEIYNALKREFDHLKWVRVSEKLPELLKAFAIKLGNAENSKQHWEIMYFVYQRHSDIANHLQSLFDCKTAIPGKDGHRAMSLEDKMFLWEQNTTGNIPAPKPSDLFEGIPEKSEELTIRTSDVATYKALILENPAYNWLLSSLKQTSILEMELSAQTRIHEKVARQLPTGRMSRHSAPRIHRCRIDFQWEPAAYRHHLIGKGDNRDPIRDLDTKKVLVASSLYVQVVTVKQYFKQTWSFNGPSFLEAFLVITNLAPGRKYSGELPDKTRLSAIAVNDEFQVTVSGSAASVAECAEQLAWLMAALQSSSRDSLSTCHPFIESKVPQLPVQLDGRISHFSVGQNIIQKPALAPALREWQEFLRMPPLVVGFPVLTRPKGCEGLEMHSLSDLLAFCEASDVTLIEGVIFIEGRQTTLFLSQTVGNILVWMNADPGDINPSGFSRITVSVKGFLEEGRHIYDPRPPKVPLHDDSGASDSNPVVFGQGCSMRNGQRLSVSRDSSSEYIDSDILSLAESSDSAKSLSLGEFDPQSLDGCFERLWSEFRGASPGYKQESGSGGNPTLKPESNDTTGSNANRARRRKRALPPDGAEDGEPGPSDQPYKKLNSEAEGKKWACPFWKKDADQHRACFRYKLLRVQDVKQHLARKHTPKYYCECCLAIFENAQHHSEHVTHVNGVYCQRDPTAELKGISHQQNRELSTKSKKAMSEIERWYHIWGILFPGAQRPKSPYMDSELSEDLCAFREFFERQAQSILAEELESDPGLASASMPNEQRLLIQSLFTRGLNRVFDSWRSTRGPMLGSDAVPIPSTDRGLDIGVRSSLGAAPVLVPEPSMASSDFISIPGMTQASPYNGMPQGSPYGGATQNSPFGNQSENPPSSAFSFSFPGTEASYYNPDFCFAPGELLDPSDEFLNMDP